MFFKRAGFGHFFQGIELRYVFLLWFQRRLLPQVRTELLTCFGLLPQWLTTGILELRLQVAWKRSLLSQIRHLRRPVHILCLKLDRRWYGLLVALRRHGHDDLPIARFHAAVHILTPE